MSFVIVLRLALLIKIVVKEKFIQQKCSISLMGMCYCDWV